MRKRVKLSIYNEEEEREKGKMIEIKRPPSSFLRSSTFPNIIGNVEDRPNESEDGDKSDGFNPMSGARTP